MNNLKQAFARSGDFVVVLFILTFIVNWFWPTAFIHCLIFIAGFVFNGIWLHTAYEMDSK
jgi:hypothetical protein